MATVLSELQAAQAAQLTSTYKAQANREAAKMATLIALYYSRYVRIEDPGSIEAWLDLMIPRLIKASDSGALTASAFFQAIRQLEVGSDSTFKVTAATGMIDDGVRKSLLTVGPYAMTNKMRDIAKLDITDAERRAMEAKVREITTANIASAVVRHTQAGGRQTIWENAAKDKVALGWVRVTRAKPCFFCAMLASRGVSYRPFGEDSFTSSNARFDGDGDAKVHDNCGCSLKPVYAKNDPLVKKTAEFADMWSRWGAGGNGETNAALRFRRGYDHWLKTGEFLSWDAVDAA